MKNLYKFREMGLLIFIVILGVFIQFKNPSFLSVENINDLLTNTAILAILSVGMMMVLLTGGIDLSIGATLALAGMTSALVVNSYPQISPILAIGIGVVVGTICGSIVGFLVAIVGVFPIIATLGMMNIFRGITFMASGGKWVSAHQMPASFKGIATSSIMGINTLVFIAVIILIIFYYFINYTRTGRQIYAVGSNRQSAKISGINTKKILWIVYTLMGSLAGLSGVLWVSKFASAQGDTAMGYELNVIAACVLGGISVAGGYGKVSGLIVGFMLLGILNNALPLINVSPFWQQAIQGGIILVAILMNALVKRRITRENLMRRKI